MIDNLKRRLLRGFSANGLSQIVAILVQIFSVPIFLQSWGNQLYGEWLILSAIPTYLAISDMGLTSAAANEMTMKVAEDNKPAAVEIFQSISFLIQIISLTLSIVVIFVVILFPINNWLNISNLRKIDTFHIIIFLTLYVLTGMQKNVILAGFRCDGNYAFGVACASISRFLEYAAVTVFVLLGASPAIAALVFWAACVFSLFFMRLSLAKKSSWLVSQQNAVNSQIIKSLIKPALASMSFPLGNAVNNQGVTIAIGSALGAKDVVIFTSLRTLSRLALQLMGVIKDAVSPEISSAYARRDMALAKGLHRYSCQFTLWLGLILVVVIALCGEWIVEIWTRGLVKFDASLLYIMLLNVVISSFWFTSISVLTSTNNHQNIAVYYLFSNLISLLLAIYFIPKLGLMGAAYSVLFTDIVMSGFVVKNSLQLLQDDIFSYLKVILIPPFFKIFKLLKI